MKIRFAKKEDIKGMLSVLGKINSKDINHFAKLKNELSETFGKKISRPYYLVAEEEGMIVGLLGYAPSRINYRIYQIFSVAVDPKYQNKGIGTALMKRVIEDIISNKRKKEDDYLILLTSLKPNYFNKFGFKTLTKIKANDSCLMALSV